MIFSLRISIYNLNHLFKRRMIASFQEIMEETLMDVMQKVVYFQYGRDMR